MKLNEAHKLSPSNPKNPRRLQRHQHRARHSKHHISKHKSTGRQIDVTNKD